MLNKLRGILYIFLGFNDDTDNLHIPKKKFRSLKIILPTETAK